MIIDKITNMGLYKELQPYEELITRFIARRAEEQLPEGKYELDGEHVFALVQRYQSKSSQGVRMESHVAYADLQYMISGEEIIYGEAIEDLQVEEDKRPDADMIFYKEKDTYCHTCILRAGCFGYYMPQDGHMPGIRVKESAEVQKIVFKIKVPS